MSAVAAATVALAVATLAAAATATATATTTDTATAELVDRLLDVFVAGRVGNWFDGGPWFSLGKGRMPREIVLYRRFYSSGPSPFLRFFPSASHRRPVCAPCLLPHHMASLTPAWSPIFRLATLMVTLDDGLLMDHILPESPHRAA